jgi:hypothetical protein
MSGAVSENPVTIMPRVKGDLDPIPFQLLDNLGVAIDITGKTLQMRLVKIADNTVKLAAGSCTISVAATGKGYYQPVAIDVDTAGDYAVYVIDVVALSTTPDPRYPFDGPKYILSIVNEDGTQ